MREHFRHGHRYNWFVKKNVFLHEIMKYIGKNSEVTNNYVN
jgi:hypothetical protein